MSHFSDYQSGLRQIVKFLHKLKPARTASPAVCEGNISDALFASTACVAANAYENRNEEEAAAAADGLVAHFPAFARRSLSLLLASFSTSFATATIVVIMFHDRSNGLVGINKISEGFGSSVSNLNLHRSQSCSG